MKIYSVTVTVLLALTLLGCFLESGEARPETAPPENVEKPEIPVVDPVADQDALQNEILWFLLSLEQTRDNGQLDREAVLKYKEKLRTQFE